MSESPLMHDHRRRDISVQYRAAVAGVGSDVERLGFDRPALGAGLACAARIDQHDLGTGTFSLVPDELDEKRPRGVVHGSGEHPAFEPGQVEVFERDALIAGDQGPREELLTSSPP